MVFALLLVSVAANWTPMRWSAADPSALKILKNTLVNCLLLENAGFTRPVVSAATDAGIDTLAVLTPSATVEQVRKASELKAKGIVLEGNFEESSKTSLRKIAGELGLL